MSTKGKRFDATNKSQRDTWRVGVLFVFFAIPGLVLFIGASALLFSAYFDPRPSLPNPLLNAAFAVVGMVMILVGLGRLRRPAYALAFLSIPVALFFFFVIDRQGTTGIAGPPLFAGVIALLVYQAVRRYYEHE